MEAAFGERNHGISRKDSGKGVSKCKGSEAKGCSRVQTHSRGAGVPGEEAAGGDAPQVLEKGGWGRMLQGPSRPFPRTLPLLSRRALDRRAMWFRFKMITGALLGIFVERDYLVFLSVLFSIPRKCFLPNYIFPKRLSFCMFTVR